MWGLGDVFIRGWLLDACRGSSQKHPDWWVHFGCLAVDIGQQYSLDWQEMMAVALSTVAHSPVHLAQLAIAKLQACVGAGQMQAGQIALQEVQDSLSRCAKMRRYIACAPRSKTR